MKEKINIADVLTFDDDSKYLVLNKIEEFKGTYYLLIGITKDEDLNYRDILYVSEQIDENGEKYVETVENEKLIRALATYTLTDIATDLSPEVRENLEESLEKLEER